MIPHSQLAPLPSELPFRIVSKTIGQGAYACIKKARPLHAQDPIFAVKFIHKNFAIRQGRITLKQLSLEVTIHQHVGRHNNIIEFFQCGEDQSWKWIAMELAEGGDLFDKIESDVGVGEDIAHLYFTQLISATAFIHSKGIAHRDLKPENILLSAEGNLKIADFGLAAVFSHQGVRKLCRTGCGSPPYTAPEVVLFDAKKQGAGYFGDLVDIWSCGVVLFVLLVGNTPWDEPGERSYEFNEYVRTNGRPDDELWQNLPSETLSLLRGMMKVDIKSRFSLDDIRRHPWFTRKNPHMGTDGKLTNPVALATQMFESMRIDFDQDPLAPSQRSQRSTSTDAMDLDSQDWNTKFAYTQPETPTNDIAFDWEKPARHIIANGGIISASQPPTTMYGLTTSREPCSLLLVDDRLADEPSFSQFCTTPSVPLSRTQYANQFRDILPSHTLTRFFSLWDLPALLPTISEALHRLGVPTSTLPDSALNGLDEKVLIKVKIMDERKCGLSGNIVVERMKGADEGLAEVEFVKVKGDPLEWRRFFKKVVVLCREAVCKPEG